jgi:NitT/TauT family transport system substrate-binding protein
LVVAGRAARGPVMRGLVARAVGVASVALVVAGCAATPAPTPTPLTPVTLQLQWAAQAQFAGYYVALSEGYFAEEGLDVKIVEGGVDIVPQTVLADGEADFAVAWVPKALATREAGAAITDVAQIFQRSGTRQVSFADENIRTVDDLKGKTVGNWGLGNEFELFAGLTTAGLAPSADVTLVRQEFDMSALLARQLDAAQAMTYNEYALLLEQNNPKTGELYQPEDFSTIDWNDVGTAMLQDAIWADSDRLATDADYEATTVKFLKAVVRGWIFARDSPEEAAAIVLTYGPKLGASHQLWQTNEVNKLIWPSPDGVGIIDADAWAQTVEVALTAKNLEGSTVLTAEPGEGAYTNEYIQKALDELADEDTTGDDFTPITVTLVEGGK